MSERRRTVAGTPERTPSEAASVLLAIVRDTLAAASALDHDTIAAELDAAGAAVRKLVAGGHLDRAPLILDAPPLRLSLSVVSGTKAIGHEENLNAVPGAATATAWTLHVPAPTPIGTWIAEDVEHLAHVTTEPPGPYEAALTGASLQASDIDLDALRRITGAT